MSDEEIVSREGAERWQCSGGALDTERRLAATIFSLYEMLEDLLAVIHCDGGHHTDAVGVEQSCGDAVEIVTGRVVRIAALEDELRLVNGAMCAQDERECDAATKCGVAYELHGCDWPDGVAEELMAIRAERDRLKAFYVAWERCESNRGCYSCCPQHDARCQSAYQDTLPCSCGRAELDAAEAALSAAQAALEPPA